MLLVNSANRKIKVHKSWIMWSFASSSKASIGLNRFWRSILKNPAPVFISEEKCIVHEARSIFLSNISTRESSLTSTRTERAFPISLLMQRSKEQTTGRHRVIKLLQHDPANTESPEPQREVQQAFTVWQTLWHTKSWFPKGQINPELPHERPCPTSELKNH